MKIKVLLALIMALNALTAKAQQHIGATKNRLEASQKKATIDDLLRMVNERYTFVDVGKRITTHIKQQAKRNVYQKIDDPVEFANALTKDLQLISKDKHLSVRYSAEILPPQQETEVTEIPASEKENLSITLRNQNYGIRKIDVLRGNIGYIDIAFFCTPEFAGDTYAAAMNYLAHTDQLIIDLRRCGGSTSPFAIPFICSYFFESPVHLNDLVWRKNNAVTQSWTYAHVPGKKYLDKPIYILTSNATFSGAEEIAYDLQVLKRATIIGQVTGGGANPGGVFRINDHFSAFIPFGRAVNPITKTNWEGIGVKPDTLISSKLALYKAQETAMQHTLQHSKDEPWKAAVSTWLNEVKDFKPVLKSITFDLEGFHDAREVYVAGSFNDWSPKATEMKKENGKWMVTTESETGKIEYKFIVDGNWMTDPANKNTERDGDNINSVRIHK